MDLLQKLPDYLNPILETNNINKADIDFYISSSLNLEMKFEQTHFIITKGVLFVIENESVKKYETEFDNIYHETKLNYCCLYGKKEDSVTLLGYFLNNQIGSFLEFEKDYHKAISHSMTNEDTHSRSFMKMKEKICPRCHKPINPIHRYCDNCYGRGTTLFRLLKYITKYTGVLAGIFVLMICCSAIGILTPILVSQIYYNEILAVGGKWYGEILLFCSLFLVLKVAQGMFTLVYGRAMAKTSAKICFDMKNDVFKSMQKLSLSFYKNRETGHLMNRITWDADQVYGFIVEDTPRLLINLMQAIGVYIYLLILHTQLALFILIPIPLVAFLFIKTSPKMRSNWQQNNARNNELNAIVSDTLEGFRVVKVFSSNKKETSRFSKVSIKNRNAFVNQTRYRAIVYPLIQFIMSSAIFILWGYGGYLVIQGDINYGFFATFVAGIEMLYSPLESMCSTIFDALPRVLTASRRMFEVIDAVEDIKESEQPITLKEVKGHIEFKNVSFSYEPGQEILKNISFEVKENTSLGIVGQTGSGKTTIVSLLSRLYDIDDGEILIDGVNVKDLSFENLHQMVSMISQDVFLFRGTILENIKYANPKATLKEVIEAAKAANAHDFIMKLPNGYDTYIGEGSVSLSGGEKQRLSIARAVLLNSKIIIFDEATSAMDTITEKAIQESINNISKGKTVIMIAHRLSTLKDVDRLIVIDKHTIVENGTMEELVKLDGKFAELYKIQKEALKFISIGDEYDEISRLS